MERGVPALLPGHTSQGSVDKEESPLTPPAPPPPLNTAAGMDGKPILDPQLRPELEMKDKGGPDETLSAIPSMEEDNITSSSSPEREEGSPIKTDDGKMEERTGPGIRMDRLLNSIEITKRATQMHQTFSNLTRDAHPHPHSNPQQTQTHRHNQIESRKRPSTPPPHAQPHPRTPTHDQSPPTRTPTPTRTPGSSMDLMRLTLESPRNRAFDYGPSMQESQGGWGLRPYRDGAGAGAGAGGGKDPLGLGSALAPPLPLPLPLQLSLPKTEELNSNANSNANGRRRSSGPRLGFAPRSGPGSGSGSGSGEGRGMGNKWGGSDQKEGGGGVRSTSSGGSGRTIPPGQTGRTGPVGRRPSQTISSPPQPSSHVPAHAHAQVQVQTRRKMGIESYLNERYGDVSRSRYPPPLPALSGSVPGPFRSPEVLRSPRSVRSPGSPGSLRSPGSFGANRAVRPGMGDSPGRRGWEEDERGDEYGLVSPKRRRKFEPESARGMEAMEGMEGRTGMEGIEGGREREEEEDEKAANVLTGMLGGSPMRLAGGRRDILASSFGQAHVQGVSSPSSSPSRELDPRHRKEEEKGLRTRPRQISRLPRREGSWSVGTHSTNATAAGHGDEEDQRAAELMIFLAQSPGSVGPRHTGQGNEGNEGNGAGSGNGSGGRVVKSVGRVLF